MRIMDAARQPGPEPAKDRTTIYDVPCTVCGCVCDDLAITVDAGRVTGVSPGCPLAEPWWLGQTWSGEASARIDGQTAALDDAVARAADILRAAKAPLVYGLSRSSTPGQRAAVRLADPIRAFLDTSASTCQSSTIMAVQSVGESTATLGEIRNRSDLVIYWGSNPLESHPRHVERFVQTPGMFVPNGRAGRQVVVVDVQRTRTAEISDTFIQIQPGGDFELIWALRVMLKGLRLDDASVAGVARDDLQRLFDLLTSCRYGAVFFGSGLTRRGVAHANVEALLRLVTELNARTRFVARGMGNPGADSVLCWQTGFPFGVSLSRGYPRYNPGEYTANDLLERREVDAAVLIGTEGVTRLSNAAQAHLRKIPNIVLDHPSVESPVAAAVQFTTAVYGIHRPGTANRMDDVPIALRAVLSSPLPADHEVLQRIMQAIER